MSYQYRLVSRPSGPPNVSKFWRVKGASHTKRVFSTIVAEEQVRPELYSPIKKRLDSVQGTLNKLSFSLARTVDIDAWSSQGESLPNLSKKSPFRGRGTLNEKVLESLNTPWLGAVLLTALEKNSGKAVPQHLRNAAGQIKKLVDAKQR